MEIKQENASALKDSLFTRIESAVGADNVAWINVGEYGFSRTLQFTVRGREYIVYWSWNESTLEINGEVEVRFNSVKKSGTWPNEFKTNLQFSLNGVITAIIPVEAYRE